MYTCTVADCGEPWADLTKDNVVLLGVMQSKLVKFVIED